MDNSRIEYILDGLTENTKLSTWEMDFIESIKDQYEADQYLTDKQRDTLEEIHRKHS